jgi:putative copper export protein/methionine-rich copper-binding protein CopC
MLVTHGFRNVALALLLSALLPSVLLAHLRLVSSEPAGGVTLEAPPSLLRFTFSARPELSLTTIAIRDSNGRSYQLTAPAADPSDVRIISTTPTSPLPSGRYVVTWRTASADGHPITGTIAFTVAGDSVSPAPADEHAGHEMTPASPPENHSDHAASASTEEEESVRLAPELRERLRVASDAVRTLAFASLFTLIGAVSFRFLVIPRLWRWQNGKRAAGALWRSHRVALGACGIYLLAHIGRLVIDGLLLLGPDAGPVRLVDALSGSAWGLGWLTGFAGLVATLVGLAGTGGSPRIGWYSAAGGCVIIAFGAGMTGHAASEPNVLPAVAMMTMHVIGAGAWMGTLLLVVVAGIPAAIYDGRGEAPHQGVAELVAAFSPIALAGASLAAITGMLAVWTYVPDLGELLRPGYGRMLLIKLGLLLLAASLGAVNWRLVTPRLGVPEGTRRLTRTSRAELVVGVLMLAVSAILVVTPLPGE